ncbi:hypothetical protein NEF87_002084 [Candidatus Lokiarchaeum ossiferum]|uniref:N-acetyltransferase domain-containing protein n=1 Tax=Candidatus Lokiarchaeum ossiferum TaxID=2951803 RepID=A0ABY6HTB6_9ARCH|nr:hypothetical protein NEF87_002084 [Candidatus Lokiarchaeum sp. B-35]
MEIQLITKANETRFFDYVHGRECEFFYYIYDYKTNFPDFRLFIAINKENETKGVFFILKNQYVKIEGTSEATTCFLDFLDDLKLNLKIITAQSKHKTQIKNRYSNYQKEAVRYRMILQGQKEQLSCKYESISLGEHQKEHIASLFRKSDPVHFSKSNASEIQLDDTHKAFGIIENNILTSAITAWNYNRIGKINTLGTHPDYLRQGRAKSLLKYTINWLSSCTDHIIIQVRAQNTAAIHLYEQLGFKIQFKHYLIYF